MDIEKELSENKTLLLLMPDADYNDIVAYMVKSLPKGKLCYVTLNKTLNSLKALLKKNKIDDENIIFIDAVSKSANEDIESSPKCFFIESPAELTEISAAVSWVISGSLANNVECLIFDSITDLLVYSDKPESAKFISSATNKIKESNVRAVFFALKVKEHEDFIRECGISFDKVIDLSKSFLF